MTFLKKKVSLLSLPHLAHLNKTECQREETELLWRWLDQWWVTHHSRFPFGDMPSKQPPTFWTKFRPKRFLVLLMNDGLAVKWILAASEFGVALHTCWGKRLASWLVGQNCACLWDIQRKPKVLLSIVPRTIRLSLARMLVSLRRTLWRMRNLEAKLCLKKSWVRKLLPHL